MSKNPLPEGTGELIQRALEEDIRTGDITSELIVPAETRGHGIVEVHEEGVLCGLDLAREVFRSLDPELEWNPLLRDGDSLKPGQVVARLAGNGRAMLSAERTAINFLQRLSGIASLTRRYVEVVRGYKAEICDTRKTTPGWRTLEKYAVRCGGGINHRMGLHDMVLIKDNHEALVGGVTQALQAVYRTTPAVPVMVEVSSLDQLGEALAFPVEYILIDNFTPDQVMDAVEVVYAAGADKRPRLEASGGINLDTLRMFAAAGVDRISVGALTHSAPSLDISLEIALDQPSG